MADMAGEICANCGRQIGKLETPMVWKQDVVCQACHKLLRQEGHAQQQRESDWLFNCPQAAVKKGVIRIEKVSINPADLVGILAKNYRRSFTTIQIYRVDLAMPFGHYHRVEFRNATDAIAFCQAVSAVTGLPVTNWRPPDVTFFVPLS